MPTDVVRRRFGRESHRNAILGWASCAKELAFAERNGVFALGKYPIWASSTPIWVFQFIPPESSALTCALFPKVRQRVLAVLFGTRDRSYYANEVIALAQSGTGAVQRELADLSAAGLLTVSKHGNQKHYQANVSATEAVLNAVQR